MKEINSFSEMFFGVRFDSDNIFYKTQSPGKNKKLSQFKIFIQEKCNIKYTEILTLCHQYEQLEQKIENLSLFLLSINISMLDIHELYLEKKVKNLEIKTSRFKYYIEVTKKWISSFLKSKITTKSNLRMNMKKKI